MGSGSGNILCSLPNGRSTISLELIRFIIVGGIGTLLNLAVFSLCLYSFGINYMVSASIAFLCAVTSNYYWNKVWTFRSGGQSGACGQYFEYVIVSVLTLCVNLGVLSIAITVTGLHPVIGQILGIAAATILNFMGSKLWVFSDRRQNHNGAEFRLIWILIIIVVIGVLLRSYDLSKESLWLDEVASFHFSSQSFIKALAAEKTNPPLYYILLHFWILLFGNSEAALRSLSIVPSIISVVLIYFLGTRIYDEKTGLIAALFMAFSTFHIFFAQEARCFALLLALLLGSMLFMDIALDNRNNKARMWPWLLYFLMTIGALYTHFYSVFFVAAENLFFLTRWRENKAKLFAWVTTQVLLFIAFLPWFITMIGTAAGGGQAFRRYLLLNFPGAIFVFLAGESLIPMDETAILDMRETILSHWLLISMCALALGCLFWGAVRAARERQYAGWLAPVMWLAPMVMAFLVSIKIPLFKDKYLIAASAPMYLFLASGVACSFEKTKLSNQNIRRCVSLLACVIITIITTISIYNYHFNPRFGKEQWREVVQYIESRADSGDLVVLHKWNIKRPYDYYANRSDLKLISLYNLSENELSPVWDMVKEVTKRHNRVWLVQSHLNTLKDPQFVLRQFCKMSKLRDEVHYSHSIGITIYEFGG